jgi:hypothetical protein
LTTKQTLLSILGRRVCCFIDARAVVTRIQLLHNPICHSIRCHRDSLPIYDTEGRYKYHHTNLASQRGYLLHGLSMGNSYKRREDQKCQPLASYWVREEPIAENSEFGSSTLSFQSRTSASDSWNLRSLDIVQMFKFPST